jgi:16S rRNA (guanine527-N7)-methyltransferase
VERVLAGVSRETRARLEIYADLLRKWQRTINLVGRSTLNELWTRHFADSA